MSTPRLLAFGLLGAALCPGLLPAATVTAPVDSYFDPATSKGYVQGYRVVGSLTPASWSWGKIELLEGYQKFRTEGYNLRTEKLRWEDTWEDDTYPLQTYFGALNQQLVDGFNLYYKNSCAGKVGTSGVADCPARGPTRPEARFVLLHQGPKTARATCDKTKTPVLLVHGAMQNANVWLYPGGNDGAGNPYPGTTQATGFVQALEAENICTYAVTYGNFHGDNISQAIQLTNAIKRVKTLTGRTKVNVVAWSKGVLPVDLYAANVSKWTDWGTKYFQKIAAEQAKWVPAYAKDMRTYVALSGPHQGIDLNWRHPYDDLLIYSTAENAPVGQGPVTWSYMAAVQCVTWGYYDSPSSPLPNQYAYSVCENRGGTWPDFWNRIYTSNLTGLDPAGQPTYAQSLEKLNTTNGLPASQFSFDEYNISMFGSVDANGKFVTAYLGQLQATYDLRSFYPTPVRIDDPITYDWSELDTDEYKWYDWLDIKIGYYPYPPYSGAGWIVDPDHVTCRNTAYDPAAYPCRAQHLYYNASTADSYMWGYATYKLMDSIGIKAAMEMGGNLIERLKSRGLSQDLDFLYVLYGTEPGAPGTIFEIDGMSSPDDDPNGDGVLFDVSVGGWLSRDTKQSFLTRSWTSANKTSKYLEEGVAWGHLEVGVQPQVWSKMIARFKALP